MQLRSSREWTTIWHAAWPWSVLIAAESFGRLLFDTFEPPAPTGYGPRSAFTTYAAIGTFVLVGFVAAARSGRLRYAPAVSFLSGLAGYVMGIVAALFLYFTVIVNDPTKLTTFGMTGGWDEAIGFSLIVPLAGTLLGFVGGMIAIAMLRLRRFAT